MILEEKKEKTDKVTDSVTESCDMESYFNMVFPGDTRSHLLQAPQPPTCWHLDNLGRLVMVCFGQASQACQLTSFHLWIW